MAASKPSPAYGPGVRMCNEVTPPRRPALSEAELFADGGLNVPLLRDHLRTEGRINQTCAKRLIEAAKAVLQEEPNCVPLQAPIDIVGDLHGQFYDLLQAFQLNGMPPAKTYLFLGDYVDRGIYSTEVMLLLLGMKVRYPRSMFLLRGNHESRSMTEYHNFRVECEYKYSTEIYTEFMECFDALPLAATVTGAEGTFLCMHGGLSPSIQTIEQINAIHRFSEIPASGPLCDITWSDPVNDDHVGSLGRLELDLFKNIRFEFNDQRGCSFRYGRAALIEFLETNRLQGIIRAHEVQEDGYKQQYFAEFGRRFPLVTTVFSAPNYCDMYDNRAAVMTYDGTRLVFRDYATAGHPFGLPDYMDALNWSLPYVTEKVTQFFAATLKMIENDPDDEDETEPMEVEEAAAPDAAASEAFRPRTTRVKTKKRPTPLRGRSGSNIVNETVRSRCNSMNSIMQRAKKLREKNELLIKAVNEVDANPEESVLTRFERARRKDMGREMLRPLQRHYTM